MVKKVKLLVDSKNIFINGIVFRFLKYKKLTKSILIDMKWREWLKKWNLSNLKIKAPFLELELNFKDVDKDAAWDLYIELLTRITTQPLKKEHGDEEIALNSIYSLFPSTRKVIKNYGRKSIEFTKIAIVVLNQIIRPFTTKWHKLNLQGAFNEAKQCELFRKELSSLQVHLKNYTKLLADMADVEDLTELEE
ncbi:MAG: hypothetical protein ACFFDF_23555 [Candidatus Odinarchaeota archaeon]